MVGGGAGMGAAAGPVGVVAGAITGLAAFGLYKLFADGKETGLSAKQLQELETLKEAHEKGFLSDADLAKEIEKVINRNC